MSMDRAKLSSCNRSQKKISDHHGSEFYALGNKTSRDDQKTKISSIKNSNSAMDRKRESSSTSTNAAKKAKITTRHSPDIELLKESVDSDQIPLTIEYEGGDLVENIISSLDTMDTDSFVKILCSCIKNITLTSGRVKPDSVIYLLLSYISKIYPLHFKKEALTSSLLLILRRETNMKSRQSLYAFITACNILLKSHNGIKDWPDVFLRLYIDDAINERMWCDNPLCSYFVANILSSFKTNAPQNNALCNETGPNQYRGAMSIEENADTIYTVSDASKFFNSVNIFKGVKRYSEMYVEKIITECIKEQLNKRQQQECYTKNFLKFLCTSSGLGEVRVLCISRLELWIHNGKLVKLAQQLLSYICANLDSKCAKNPEVLAVLLKMRFKTKPLINFYMSCFKELIICKPDLLYIILKFVVQNELSNTRNPNNMGMLASMFQLNPDKSASHLAEIYKEFLLQKDDCLRTLRVFLRELVRMLRFDINITLFCKVFLNGRSSLNKQIEQCEYKDRIFMSMVDIICLCMLISASPQVREACIALRTCRDNKINAVLAKFYSQMSEMQLDAISWMYETVPNLFKMQSIEYNQSLHKILLLESAEQYSRCDQWPSESERSTLLRIVSETPIHQETLLRIILIGITKDIPFTIPDTIDILMLVIKRVSSMRSVDYPAINVNKFDIIDFLFSMTEYHHPENIKLPDDYDPPKLAITILYWKAWLIMLMISAHNPSTFGSFCWDHYPTMKSLIEMCITNQFNDSVLTKDELQILSVERNHILEFESYLAAQTSQAVITEENAILISQLMLMDPMGPARKVPPGILEQLKLMNKTLKLGLLLCRSRKPDLLLDIIERQGTTQSMPWLSDLVQNSEGEFNHLPVQCLCEFLMFNANIINEDNTRDAELVNFLRNILMEPNSNSQSVCEILDYIFRRLSSSNEFTRLAAIEGMKLIFKISKDEQNYCVLRMISQNPHFPNIKAFVIPHIRAACQVENSPRIVMSYIQFIATHTVHDSVAQMLDHVIDMSQLIVERSTLFQHIIPTPNKLSENYESQMQTLKCLFVMFNNYIIKLREIHDSYEWTEYPDLLMVQFNDGIQLPLHLNIIHAFIILLSLAAHFMHEAKPILDYWFPLGTISPRAYILNTVHEQMQLLPDWLKLKMIRSSVDQLTEAALHELMPDQIVLFVQNFGTPVKSMSKLLARLDHAVIEQCESVKNAILNKTYLAQLIEIQRGRGAKNGHFTVNALQLCYHSNLSKYYSKLNKKMYEILNITVSPLKRNYINITSTYESEAFASMLLSNKHSSKWNKFVFRRSFNQLLRNHTQINSSLVEKKINSFFNQFTETVNIETKDVLGKLKLIQLNTFCRIMKGKKNVSFDTSSFLNIDLSLEISKNSNINYFEMVCCYLSMKKMLKGEVKSKNKLEEVKVEQLEKQMWNTISKYFQYNPSLSKSNNYVNENELSRQGILVDCFTETDPEFVIACSKNLHISMLFSMKFTHFRFYLLSLICHQTNWTTLISTLTYLFQNTETDLDYNTVLNFLEAFICNQKLWQGSDKSVSNSYQKEFAFSLNTRELEVLTQFIIKEGIIEINQNILQYDYKLYSRINLLLIVINKKFDSIANIVDCVLKHPAHNNLKHKIFYQIYLMYPSIKFIKLSETEKASKLQTLKGCQADKVSNSLITCLGNLVLKKDFETLSTDSELLIRKLASSHPALFLRQLGLLISVVQERAQLNIRTIRDGYSFQKFLQILRILELLQPLIFDDVYKKDFLNCIEYFFSFLKTYINVKDIYQILIKFVELLQKYINMNPSSSKSFLERHVPTLLDLSAKFRSVASLQNLLQRIALLQHSDISSTVFRKNDVKLEIYLKNQAEIKSDSVVTIDEETNDFSPSSYSSHLYKKSFIVSPHYLNLISIIKHSNSEDTILGPLQEIESLTSKRFSFLSDLFDRLLELIFSQSAQIRSNAFILLIRHLKHNPGCSYINQCTLNSYIKCLRSANSSVASTAVDNLTEMTILLHEYVVEILTVAFSLGIKSRLNTCSQIKRILQTLSLQHGC